MVQPEVTAKDLPLCAFLQENAESCTLKNYRSWAVLKNNG